MMTKGWFMVACLGWSGLLVGQEFGPGNEGYIEVVNAIALKTPTEVSLNRGNEPLWTEMESGHNSGVMPLFTGDYLFRVRNEECVKPEISETIKLTGGAYHTVILYTDLEEKEGEMVPRLRLSRFSGDRKVGEPKLSIVSVSKRPEVQISVGGNPVTLASKRPRQFPVKMEDEVVLKQGAEKLETLEITSPVAYLVFLYDQPDSALLGTTVVRQIMILPPKLD
ncbi:MAG: hypothetical protein AAF191_10125 [Verrucomicrobiota bacterium]